MRQCKNCIFGVFPVDPESGARKWAGTCSALMGVKDLKSRKIIYVEQHFHCSNGNYRERYVPKPPQEKKEETV